MAKKIIPYSIILKRSSCLNSVIESDNCADALYDRIKPLLDKDTLSCTESKMLDSYFNAISNKSEAGLSYNNALAIIESKRSDGRIKSFCTKILPYIENLNYIQETLDKYDISEEDKDTIMEYTSMYNIADRILKNHASLSKRFNIEKEVAKFPYIGLESVCTKCASFLDTYSFESYKKLNLTLEEVNYLMEKNGFTFDKYDMVKYVTEYFLLADDSLNSNQLAKYKLALQENYFLTESDIDSVKYLFEYSKVPNKCLNESVRNFYREPEKTIENFQITQTQDLVWYTALDLENNIGRYITFLWNVWSSGLFPDSKIEEVLGNICDAIYGKIDDIGKLNINDQDYISKESIKNIKSNIIFALENIKTDDMIKLEKLSVFKSIIQESILDRLDELCNIIYSKNNLEAIDFVCRESTPTINLKDYKIFKFNGLIKASINLDKYLKNKAANMMNKFHDKRKAVISKVNNILFDESNMNIYSYIGEDHKVDICVAQYFYNEDFLSDIHDEFDYICKDFNTKLKLNGDNSCKAYYIVNPGILEVHVKDATMLELTEQEIEECRKAESYELNVYIESLAIIDSIMETFNNMDLKEPISETLIRMDNLEEIDVDHFNSLVETLKYLEVSREDIELFTERYSSALFNKNGNTIGYLNESKKIQRVCENWESCDDLSLDIELEAYQIFNAILEDATNVNKKNDNKNANDKAKNNKSNGKFDLKKMKNDPNYTKQTKLSPEEEKDIKKNPFKGINLNSIRLLLKGLESKVGNLSNKYKEACKNLDAASRRLVKAMKDALISDSRESIIKGSVIPSFSKCIHIGLILLGIFKFVNPCVAIIVAVGGFAISKRLTMKERALMLDEIEVELEVVEEEINLARSNNQLKKLRALLQTKKSLQRQYQRIRYNIKVGKNILPNSEIGLKKTD